MATTSTIKVERSARIVSPKGRASYPTLFTARAFNESSDPKFSITLMVQKNAEGKDYIEKLTEARNTAIKALIGAKKPGNLELWGINDGDESDDPDMHGHYLVKASSKTRPAAVDLDKVAIEDEDTIYGGCFVRVSLCAKAYGTPAKCGCALELVAVQKVAEGDPFSASAKAKIAAVSEFDSAEF